MRCPALDGELATHNFTDTQGITKVFHTCPSCSGLWMDLFSANYLKLTDIPSLPNPKTALSVTISPTCPVCQTALARAQGDNIPTESTIYRCSQGHGYFFPQGEFTRFKQAQEAKINYFKTWKIPIASLATVLLGCLVIVVLSGGLLAGIYGSKSTQYTETQASSIIKKQQAIVTPNTNTATVVVTTNRPTKITLNIDRLNYHEPMTTRDQYTHTSTIFSLPSGSYSYSFTFDPPLEETIPAQVFSIP